MQIPGGQTSAERQAGLEGELNESLGIFDETMAAERAAVASGSGYGGSTGDAAVSGGVGEGSAAAPATTVAQADTSLVYPGQEGQASQAGSADGSQPGQSGDQSAGDKPSDRRILVASRDGGGPGGGQSVVGGRGGDDRPHSTEIPDDIAVDGSDDEIVARQLREAAMNEPDPELRDKLWQEYRNYKKASRR